jgi:hypothetical protein
VETQNPNRYYKVELESHRRRSVDLVTADETVENSEVNGDHAEPKGELEQVGTMLVSFSRIH